MTIEDDELIVTDADGELQYNPNDVESQMVQETLFEEKRIIIENCLFSGLILITAVWRYATSVFGLNFLKMHTISRKMTAVAICKHCLISISTSNMAIPL